MVGLTSGILVLLGTLAAFGALGFTTRTRGLDVEQFTVARSTQAAGALGLSFLASGLGAWILFAPPIVGAQLGVVAAMGYAVGAAGPFLLFGLLGPRMRRVAPAGGSLTEFVRARFGTVFHRYVIGVSVAYMLLFLTAELTGIAAVVAIIAGVDPRLTVLAVAAVTLAYTAYAGLPASLRTDRWQAWLIMGLLLAGGAAMVLGGGDAAGSAAAAEVLQVGRLGFEVAVALIIAVTAANMFHQGYWQRVWAARDDQALRRGSWLGGALTVPVVAIIGGLGLVAAARGIDLGEPAAPFFALLVGLPAWVGVVVLVLGVALVCSSVDTLENGLAALVAAERPDMRLSAARWATAALMVPAVLLALRGYDVLRLFLIADLLCAATVVPALLGLWRRATAASALAGSVAGLIGALTAGILAGGSLAEGLTRVTFPLASPTLPEFAAALLASSAVAVGVALASGGSTDLGDVGAAVADRRTSPSGSG
jgi:solute:Na+ symporter, SSS family